MSPRKIAETIQAANFQGFSGNCGAAALAINEILFKNSGKLVGAFNSAFLKKGKPKGHIAVLYENNFWDSDGKPKSWEDIEAWGMLDPNDPNHKIEAEKLGISWTDKTAESVTKKTLSKKWALKNFDPQHLETFRIALLEI